MYLYFYITAGLHPTQALAASAKRLEDEFRVMQSKFNDDIARLQKERAAL